MSKRPKNRRTSRGPKSSGPSAPAPRGSAFGLGGRVAEDPDADLRREITAQIAAGPMNLLIFASTFIAGTEPGPLDRSPDNRFAIPDAIAGLRSKRLPEADALAVALANVAGLELQANRSAADAASHGSALPDWVGQLGDVRPTRAVARRHVFGDTEHLAVELTTPTGVATMLFLIDHNAAHAVADGFIVSDALDGIIDTMERLVRGEDGWATVDVPLPDARAQIERGIRMGASMYPPFETEAWPAARPLATMLLQRMPEASVLEDDDVDERVIDALVTELVTSPQHPDLNAADASDDRDIASFLLRHVSDYFGPDPLRWSPEVVEILLTDHIPRKLHAPMDYLGRIPAVMREVIVFADSKREVPSEFTARTLVAVDEFEGDFRDAIGDDDWVSEAFGDEDFMKSHFIRIAGSEEALEGLDTVPLPDEPLNLAGIPDDIHDRVTEVAELAAQAGGRLFGDEMRTAVQRIAAKIAASDPALFRRRFRTETTAAALLWIAAHANSVFRATGVEVQDLMAEFGLKGSPNQRAEVLLRALGVDRPVGWSYGAVLGDAALLTSARRAQVIDMWEFFEARMGE